ncbi:MAG: hypothetical protein KY396_06005, partial [Actinobacteria bacterium]|nr:hypothetical protein [Actinomycetota bacterium]
GAEGETYDFRVVALDRHGNRRISAIRTVTVPIDDASAALTYTGEWSTEGGSPADFRGTLHTGGAGASVTYAFTGSWVAVVGRGSEGTALVSIDGGADETFSIPPGGERTVLFTRDLGTSGPHTIRVTSSTTPLAIDAIASR